jgi:hypothetical protein
MTITISGYQQDNQGAWISKDPTAQLVYSLDWSAWLNISDAIQSIDVNLQARANDPQPLVLVNSGISTNSSGKVTFTELSGGQVGKVYTITTKVTTQNGLIDSRSFRVKIENRSA